MRPLAQPSTHTPATRPETASQVMSDCASVELRVAARRYHFHGPLLLYLITTVVLVFGAINGQNNLLFWLFGLAVGGLIVSGILSGAALMGLQVTRIAPLRAQVGVDCIVRYEIRHRGFLIPACALIIEEIEDRFAHSHSDFRSRAVPGVGFVPMISPRSTAQCFQRVGAIRRGEIKFGAVRVSTTFPFGLTRKSVVFAGESIILIRPRLLDIRFPIRGRGHEREDGALAGDSGREGEFFALREFARGDSARDVAWRPTARFGMPLVRACSPPRARRELIILDACVDDASLDAVVSGAATLASEAFRNGSRFSIVTRRGETVLPEGSGAWHLRDAFDRLARFHPEVVGNLERPPLRNGTLVTCDPAPNGDAVSVFTCIVNGEGRTGAVHASGDRLGRLRRFLTGGEA